MKIRKNAQEKIDSADEIVIYFDHVCIKNIFLCEKLQKIFWHGRGCENYVLKYKCILHIKL
jgi:hypothetical protein